MSAINHITYIFWLAEESMGALRHFWPITLALVAAVVAAAIFNSFFLPLRFHRRQLLVLLPPGVSVLILIWGSVMRGTGLAPDWPQHVIGGLLIVQFLTAVAVVWALKGYRWFSAAAILLELWVGLAFAFVASMAVTGNWL